MGAYRLDGGCGLGGGRNGWVENKARASGAADVQHLEVLEEGFGAVGIGVVGAGEGSLR